MKLPPVRLCFNDASWIQAMWPNPKCKIERLAVRATGATFNISCSGDPGHLDGTVEIKFDGKEHMTSTTKGKMTFKDKALDTTAVNDWRWKNAQCSADDINLLKKSGK